MTFVTIVLTIFIILDIYTYQAVRTLVRGNGSRTRRIAAIAYWLLSLLIAGLLIYSLLSRRGGTGITPLAQWTINAFIILFVSKLTIFVFLLLEDIYRFGAWLAGLVRRQKEPDAAGMPGRRKFVSTMAVTVAALPFSSFIYGAAKGKYNYKVHRKRLYFRDLPDKFDGFTITQLSDIHAGSLDDIESVRRGIELAAAQKSDLFVFTGDMINNLAEEALPFRDIFSLMKAPYGQFSILGNHDYGEFVRWKSKEEEEANIRRLIALQQEMGYRVLLNEHATIEKEGQKITLIGVENWGVGFTQRGDLNKALEGADRDSFKILLSHDPTHWENHVRDNDTFIHLTLAGHTHGFQMGIETSYFRWSPVQYRYQFWADLGQENGRMIYINRGFGFLGFSGRVGIWPEITVIELKKLVAA